MRIDSTTLEVLKMQLGRANRLHWLEGRQKKNNIFFLKIDRSASRKAPTSESNSHKARGFWPSELDGQVRSGAAMLRPGRRMAEI